MNDAGHWNHEHSHGTTTFAGCYYIAAGDRTSRDGQQGAWGEGGEASDGEMFDRWRGGTVESPVSFARSALGGCDRSVTVASSLPLLCLATSCASELLVGAHRLKRRMAPILLTKSTRSRKRRVLSR